MRIFLTGALLMPLVFGTGVEIVGMKYKLHKLIDDTDDFLRRNNASKPLPTVSPFNTAKNDPPKSNAIPIVPPSFAKASKALAAASKTALETAKSLNDATKAAALKIKAINDETKKPLPSPQSKPKAKLSEAKKPPLSPTKASPQSAKASPAQAPAKPVVPTPAKPVAPTPTIAPIPPRVVPTQAPAKPVAPIPPKSPVTPIRLPPKPKSPIPDLLRGDQDVAYDGEKLRPCYGSQCQALRRKALEKINGTFDPASDGPLGPAQKFMKFLENKRNQGAPPPSLQQPNPQSTQQRPTCACGNPPFIQQPQLQQLKQPGQGAPNSPLAANVNNCT